MSCWLNEDLTKSETADHFLKECINTKKYIPAGSTLQISQCVNISFPRKNKEAETTHHDPKKSVIKIMVTDGKNSLPALLIEPHPNLSSSTYPGTKIELNQDIPVVLNCIILNIHNVRVLGGTVPAMVDQWKMQTASENLKCWDFRFMNNVKDGPPLWKPFSSKRGSTIDTAALRNVKAMDIVKEQKESQKTADDPSKSKFDAQRQEVISELTKQSQLKSKSFGEGKRLVDKGILDIVNEGFTEEEAEEALRKFKNPQKALKYLKGNVKSRESGIARLREAEKEKDLLRGRGGGGRRGGRRGEREDDGPTGNEIGEQPSNSINLFGFIEQKMKKDSNNDSASSNKQESEQQKYTSGGYESSTRTSGGAANNTSYGSEDRSYHRGGYGGRPSRGGRYDNRGGSGNEDSGSRYDSRPPRSSNYSNDDRGGGGGRGGSSNFKGFRSDRWDGLSSQNSSNKSEFRRGDGTNLDGPTTSEPPRERYQQRRNDSSKQYQKPDRANFASTIIKNNHGFSRPSTGHYDSSSSGGGGGQGRHKNSQSSSEFDGLKSSNFPSLIDEPPPSRSVTSAAPAPSNTLYSRPPPHQEYKYGSSEQSSMDQYHYRSSGDDNSNYGRQQQQRGDGGYHYRPPPQQHQQQPSFQPSRNRGGGGGHYDQYESKRMPQQSNDRQWAPAGGGEYQGQEHHHHQGYNQFNQQFSNLSMQQQQQPDYSQNRGNVDTEWRPSHTMVFSRSKNAGPPMRNHYNNGAQKDSHY